MDESNTMTELKDRITTLENQLFWTPKTPEELALAKRNFEQSRDTDDTSYMNMWLQCVQQGNEYQNLQTLIKTQEKLNRYNPTHDEIIEYLCCGNTIQEISFLYYSVLTGKDLGDLEDEVSEWVKECADNQ